MSSLPDIYTLHAIPAEKPARQPELGDLLVSYLKQIGVEYVFGVPGGAIEPLYNALARSARRGGPRPIVARHETGAAFMADGYARETGRLGVCCATTGPGSTNLITGVASAHEDNVPMLVITAQTSLPTFGKGALQESSCTAINTVGMFEFCTRYNSLVSHTDQFEGKLISAIMTAHEPPAGPAHLSVPLDLMRAPAPVEGPSFRLDLLLQPPSLLDESGAAELFNRVNRARRVVLVVGSGCAEAIGAIQEFAELIGAHIVTTPQGKGLVSSFHPQFRGVFGFAGHDSAREALQDASVDLILAIGTGLGEWDTSGWDTKSLLNEKLIHIDAAAERFARSPMACLHVRGRLLTLFEALLDRLHEVLRPGVYLLGKAREKTPRASGGAVPLPVPDPAQGKHALPRITLNDEAKCFDDSTPIKPQRLMYELPRLFPPNTRFLADAGNSFAWTTHYLHPRRCGTYRVGMGFGAMAWAIGSAVGTALGSRDTPVVCVTGDGSFLMSGQELTVAVAEHLPVVFVVLNDQALGMVKHGQRLGGGERIGFELARVDFTELAHAMGAEAYTIHSPDDLLALDMKAICRRRGPTLLDVHVDPEEVPPMGVRMKVLTKS
jgi:acetolactate synthase I/II/III large subunit